MIREARKEDLNEILRLFIELENNQNNVKVTNELKENQTL